MTLGDLKKLTLAAIGAIAMVVPAFAELPELAVPVIKMNYSSNYTYLACPYSKVQANRDATLITHIEDVKTLEPNYVWKTVNKDLEKRYGKPTTNSHQTLIGRHVSLNYNTKDGQYLHVIKDSVEGDKIVAVRVCQDNSDKCLFTPTTAGEPILEANNLEPWMQFANHCQSVTVAAILRSRGLDVTQEEVGRIIGRSASDNSVTEHNDPKNQGYDYGRLSKYGIRISPEERISESLVKKIEKSKESMLLGGEGHYRIAIGYDANTKLVKVFGAGVITQQPLDELIKKGYVIQSVKSPNLGHPLDTKSPGIKIDKKPEKVAKTEVKPVAPKKEASSYNYQPSQPVKTSSSPSSDRLRGSMSLSKLMIKSETSEPSR